MRSSEHAQATRRSPPIGRPPVHRVDLSRLARVRRSRLAWRAAVALGSLVLAGLIALALSGLGANRAQEEVLLAQVQASDTWNEYQANSLKKHINSDVAVVLTKQGFADEAKKLIDANNTKYIPNQDRLMPQAKDLEHERDTAHDRHNSYQIAEAAFQLAIVLCSIAIVARALWLVFAGAGLGIIGLLALLNGFLMLIKFGGH